MAAAMETEQDLQSQPQSLLSATLSMGREKKCPYCPSEFRKADHFHRHVRSHTKEKPFRCHICRKAYPRHDTLLRHARIHKQHSETASSSEKTPSSHAAQTNSLDHTQSSQFPTTSSSSIVPPEESIVPVYEEQVTPGSQSTRNRLEQTDAPIPLAPGLSPFKQILPLPTQDDSQISSTGLQGLHPGIYHAATLDQFQAASSVLSSPPGPENESSSIAQSTGYDIHDPLGAGAFQEPPTFNSEHWFLEDNFDFTILGDPGHFNVFQEPQRAPYNDMSISEPRQLTELPKQRLFVSDLRKFWYVQVSGTDDEPEVGSGTITPAAKAPSSLDDIDETYRVRMAKMLRPSLRDEPLPSIEFLNLCIHLFFTRFNVALPLIHSPTFRPTQSNALLVLSICSAGCLSLGSDSAARISSMLFERVNKAIVVAPWERALARSNDQTWQILKASMIGQTYALLSEDPAHRATAAAYLGTLIAAVRRHKLLSPTPAFHLEDNLSAEQLEKTWRTWARHEELRRIAILLYIHDAEVAALFHHEPIFRHNAGYVPTVCSQELFSAPSATVWASLFRGEQRERQFESTGRTTTEYLDLSGNGQASRCDQVPPISTLQRNLGYSTMFNVWNGLSGIGASIFECRHLDLLSLPMISKFESDLITFYASIPRAFKAPAEFPSQTEAPFSLLPLWHYTFITLSTNLNFLEIAVGREGSEIDSSIREYVLSWIASSDSKRCLLHALFLQNLIVSTNIGALVAIHTPRILFSAALCWFCYMLYQSENPSAAIAWGVSSQDGILEVLSSLPEMQLLQEGKSMSSGSIYPVPQVFDKTLAALPKILNANLAEMKASTLCVIESILRRLGTSGISLRFADIIQAFLSGETDKIAMDQRMSRLASQQAA